MMVRAGSFGGIMLQHKIDMSADACNSRDGRLRPSDVHVRRGIIDWDPQRFKLYRLPELRRGFSALHGQMIWRRVRDMPLANANMLDYWWLFPEMIPRACDNVCTCFFGTHYIEERERDEMFVRCLWNSGGKRVEIDILINGFGFSSDCRIALYE
jgi:hypothetical protein